MTTCAAPALEALERILQGLERAGVAVSGGVDSMTLAFLAHRTLGAAATMYHAVSPAVPADATARVQRYARRESWRLAVLDAGEFTDARYRANPANRCYYCKSNLYASIARATDAAILSGTNVDDLGDYRPGLEAAEEHGVRHPYVEAGIDKTEVRRIAARLGLDDVAELPAAPCLSSRIETGIAIDAAELAAVYRAERLVRRTLAPRTVRCRVRRHAIAVELDEGALAAVSRDEHDALARRVGEVFRGAGLERPVEFHPYRMGSAFLRPTHRD